jgi:signal transduction histidine kinase
MADPEQLHRLWLILLDNAIKYTPRGGSVNARVGFTNEGGIFGEIADTGIGIAPEHQSLIFDRFYWTDKARSRSMGGARSPEEFEQAAGSPAMGATMSFFRHGEIYRSDGMRWKEKEADRSRLPSP